MGQAKIVSGGPGGKYNIELVFETSRSTARLAKITKRLDEELPGMITAQEAKATNAQLKADADEYTLSATIAAYSAGAKKYEDIKAATDVYVKSLAALKAEEDLLSKLKLETTTLTMEKKKLEELLAPVSLSNVWCADKTQGLAAGTVVGTAELNGELLITKTVSQEATSPPPAPTYTASPAPLIMQGGKAAENKIQPAWSGTPAGTFFNWALLPWWQKRKPTYRAGVIISINYATNKCAVLLFNEKSSKLGQGLDIRKDNTFDGWWNDEVPIEYMSCNAAAFKVMDEVLVELTGQDWEKPKVIGFLKNPKPCSLLVPIRFLNVAGNAEFITLANARIAQLEQDKIHATYCKETFIPQVIACYDNAVAANIITSDVANWLKTPWTDWRDDKGGTNGDLGYTKRIEQDDKAIAAWTMARNIASAAAGYLWGQYTGCLDPANNSTAIIPSFVMNVDCEEVAAQTAILVPTATTDFQREWDVRNAAEILWKSLGTSASPICDGKVYVGGFCEFKWKSRGVLDPGGNFYLLTTDYSLFFYNNVEPPETTEVTISETGGGVIFRWPSPIGYNVMWKPLKGAFGTSSGLALTVRVKGNLPNVMTDFGGAVKPLKGGDFMVIMGRTNPVRSLGEDQGGPYAKASAPDTSPVNAWSGRVSRVGDVIPMGFETFAGQYPTHPIVTGVDARAPVIRPSDEELVLIYDVNYSVNSRYTYLADATNYDHWRFLGEVYTSGDCEDFAITKIQTLLNLGFSISRLKLQGGIKRESYFPKRYDSMGNEIMKEIGHIWVLVDGGTVLDQAGGLKTLADMSAYSEIRTQVSGLVWRMESTKKTYTAVPWPHTGFDTALMTMNAAASKATL